MNGTKDTGSGQNKNDRNLKYTPAHFLEMIVLRYDEIGLKSRFVRKKFEDTLIGNIKRVVARDFATRIKIKRDYGRIYVLDDKEEIARRISKVFGVVGTEMAEKLELDLERNAIEIAKMWNERVRGRSFAVRVRRTGNHDFTSMDAARIIGGKVKELTGSVVDLKNPDVKIQIEIRDNDVYVVYKSFPGYGGLPTGTQEKVLSILNNSKSLLSTWFALKRGCDVDLIVEGELESIDRYLNILKFWAAYRRIGVIHSEGGPEKMLEMAYELDYKGVYSSITAEELDSFYRILLNRTKPVYMPLLPFSDEEIEKKLDVVVKEAGG